MREDHACMHLRQAVTLILCCGLLMTQAAGIHVHVATTHAADEHALALDQHRHAALVVLVDEHHADRHLAQGEFDVDAADATTGKLPSMPLLLALACIVFALYWSAPGGTAWTRAYRPPARRSRLHVQPPSHGPPLIAS